MKLQIYPAQNGYVISSRVEGTFVFSTLEEALDFIRKTFSQQAGSPDAQPSKPQN